MYDQQLSDAIKEIEQLKAENETMRSALEILNVEGMKNELFNVREENKRLREALERILFLYGASNNQYVSGTQTYIIAQKALEETKE